MLQADLQEADGEVQDAELGVDLSDLPSPTAAAAPAQDVQKVKKKRKKAENSEAAAPEAEVAHCLSPIHKAFM